MAADSETALMVLGSYMTGRVYKGVPSMRLSVALAPIFLHTASMSGYSTQTVLYGIPLIFRQYLNVHTCHTIPSSRGKCDAISLLT